MLHNPPAPQGAVPRTHQVHQDYPLIPLAEPNLSSCALGTSSTGPPGLPQLVYFFLSESGTGRRLRAPPTTCHAPDLGPQGHLPNQAAEPPLQARPGFWQARGFVKAQVPSRQLVLVLVRILVQYLVILVLDV